MFMQFELDNDEITKIKALDAETERMHIEIINQYPEDEQSDARTKAKIELSEKYLNIVSEIRRKARARSLKYYASNIQKLVDALREELRNAAVFTCTLERPNKRFQPLDGEELDIWKKSLTNSFKPYLELLTPTLYSDIISYIDYVFINRGEIYREYLNNKRKPISLSYNGDAIEALALIRGKGKINPYSEGLEVKGVNLFAPESALKIGAGAVKIYRYAVSEFTKRNHCNATDERLKLRYILDLEDFAKANGIDTDNADAMKNFRRKTKSSLDKLSTTTITWSEKIKGQPKTFAGVNYIGGYSLKGNELMIEFTLSMAQYLASLPLIIYPRSLYALDDRDYNAYALGEAMCIHYSQDNNVIKGTECKLRVETLLKSTSYPSYEEIKANRWSWVEKVKELFEAALDKLTQCGLISDWVYCHEGGIELTDKEAAQIVEKGYGYFINLIVKYKLNDFGTHEDRAIAIQEKKNAQLEKAKRARKRKTPPKKE